MERSAQAGRDFHRARLRGKSFKGQDLSRSDFSHANIRGVDFTGSLLVGANFDYARAGLKKSWTVGLTIGALFSAVLAGLIVGVTSAIPAFVATLPVEEFTLLQQKALPLFALVALATLLYFLLTRGPESALVVFAVLTALVALGSLIPHTADITATNLILLAGIGAPVACIVALAIALKVFEELLGSWSIWVLATLAVAVAMPALWEGVYGFGPQEEVIGRESVIIGLLIASATTFAFLLSSIYVSNHISRDDKRYSAVQKIFLRLMTYGGTKFCGANLTDASFVNVSLKYTDLRDAVLEHTNWEGATHLDHARIERTYLSGSEIRSLATSKNGRGQVYDYQNLEGLNLDGANLTGASFIGAILSKATMHHADLSRSRLVGAQLYGADLSGAILTGAFIENWAVSIDTCFDDVECEYIFMRLPTDDDPDPMRKPDNHLETFQEGDFEDFIAPIVKTLDLYQQDHFDLRKVGKAFKTLDLIHHNDIDPEASAIALYQLAEQHPDAKIEIVTLDGRSNEKIRLQAVVSEKANRSMLSADYDELYDSVKSLPRAKLESLLVNISRKDEEIRHLKGTIAAASSQSGLFYVQTRISLGVIVKSLFLAANPLDADRLSLDIEIREIMEKLTASKYRDVIELIPVLAVRPDDLLQSLNTHMPQIVHFSGHGTDAGEIILLDDEGTGLPISTEALQAVFSTMKDNIRLVILNACYSEVQAEAITAVIDCTIGMNDAITDEAAIRFIASFYRAIGFGRSIKAAYEQGLASLLLEDFREEDVPVLLTKAGVDPAKIILVAPLSV